MIVRIDESKLDTFEGVAAELVKIADAIAYITGRLRNDQGEDVMKLTANCMDLRYIASALGHGRGKAPDPACATPEEQAQMRYFDKRGEG